MSLPDLILDGQKYARPAVTRILARYHGNDVDDVLQNAAFKALRHAGEFRGESDFKSWFYRIALNEAYMYVRSKKAKNFVGEKVLESLPDTRLSPYQAFARKEVFGIVEEEIARLSPLLRSAALNIFCKAEKISNTEKSRRFRARAKLAERFRERGLSCRS